MSRIGSTGPTTRITEATAPLMHSDMLSSMTAATMKMYKNWARQVNEVIGVRACVRACVRAFKRWA